MDALQTVLAGSLDARVRRAIRGLVCRNGMSVGAFGAAVLRDRDFVASLRRGSHLRTVDSMMAVSGEPLAAPRLSQGGRGLPRGVGDQRSVLRQKTTDNRSFVTQLLRGVSSTLATVEAVREWMGLMRTRWSGGRSAPPPARSGRRCTDR